MTNIEDKILKLVKLKSPVDPVAYVQGVVKTYALEKTNDGIKACNDCELCNYGVKSIAYGDNESNILVICESVSDEQYNAGNAITLPMMDSDGDTFDRALSVIKANKEALYIMNSVNCYPARMNKDTVQERIPSVKERTACKKHVDRVIDTIKPDVIIALGSVAANSLSTEKLSIVNDRGKQFDYRGYPVMPTFNPGFFRKMADNIDEEIMNMYKDNFLVDLYTGFMIAKESNPNCKIGNIELPF